ncbi:MAG: hypothetical protein ACXVLQ_12315 [Bacteriovorax sp.]
MNKLLLIIFIFGITEILPAQEKTDAPTRKIQGSKELPRELNLLVEGLQAESIDEMIPVIMNIDSYARALNKEDIFLVGKIEIYKTLLKSAETSPRAAIDGDTLKILKEAIKKTNDPFIKWFFQALLQDAESLLNSPAFKDYLLQKNTGRLDRLEFKKIEKKVQLLYRWTSKINPGVADFQETFLADLNPVMKEALRNIEESFFLMALSSADNLLPIKSATELKFFALREIKKVKKPGKKEKTVDDILAPITGEGKLEEVVLPEPSNEDWTNEDNSPLNLKNLPKPSDDADWLQDF